VWELERQYELKSLGYMLAATRRGVNQRDAKIAHLRRMNDWRVNHARKNARRGLRAPMGWAEPDLRERLSAPSGGGAQSLAGAKRAREE